MIILSRSKSNASIAGSIRVRRRRGVSTAPVGRMEEKIGRRDWMCG
jgi:hypothetical protein